MNDPTSLEPAIRSKIDGLVAGISNASKRRRRRLRRELDAAYWQLFLDVEPADARNLLSGPLRAAPEGSTNSVRSPMHLPEIMTEHVREIARVFGAGLAGVLEVEAQAFGPLDVPERAERAVLLVVAAPDDPERHAGIGGQIPVQNAMMAGFILAAYFREAGYRATLRCGDQRTLASLAARAGLGTLGASGRLVAKPYGDRCWVGDVVFTDFPLSPTS